MWKNEYYLAGGTALALQIGHRDSVDFDFFKQEPFDVGQMIKKLKRSLIKTYYQLSKSKKTPSLF